jgi:hypothetical protein
VIIAGAAGEASLKITLSYDITAKPTGVLAAAVTAQASQSLPSRPSAGSS